MQFTVSAVSADVREWQSQNGAMLTYKMKGTFPGKAEEMVSINTVKGKPKVPFMGEVIECEISKDDPAFGKTIKRSQMVPGGFSTLPTGTTPSQHSGTDTMNDSIQRQNALTNATNFVIEQAKLYYSTDHIDDALSAMTTDEVARVHAEFLHLNRGTKDVVESAKEVFSEKQEPLPSIDEAF